MDSCWNCGTSVAVSVGDCSIAGAGSVASDVGSSEDATAVVLVVLIVEVGSMLLAAVDADDAAELEVSTGASLSGLEQDATASAIAKIAGITLRITVLLSVRREGREGTADF